VMQSSLAGAWGQNGPPPPPRAPKWTPTFRYIWIFYGKPGLYHARRTNTFSPSKAPLCDGRCRRPEVYHRSKAGPFCTPSSCTKREMGCVGPYGGAQSGIAHSKHGLSKTMRCPACTRTDGPCTRPWRSWTAQRTEPRVFLEAYFEHNVKECVATRELTRPSRRLRAAYGPSCTFTVGRT